MSERQNGLELVKEAITKYYGERCDEDEPGCPCCDVWAWFDAACARTDWQAIETAPNGISILVANDDGEVELISADDNDYDWRPYSGKEGWCTKPTHWMPTQEPPK